MAGRRKIRLPRSGFVHLANIHGFQELTIAERYQNLKSYDETRPNHTIVRSNRTLPQDDS